MHGRGQSARSLFSYVSLEERATQRHPLRRIRSTVDEALEVALAEFRGVVLKARPYVGAARASASGAAAPGSLQRAQRAAVDGAPGVSTCCFAGSWAWSLTSGCGT